MARPRARLLGLVVAVVGLGAVVVVLAERSAPRAPEPRPLASVEWLPSADPAPQPVPTPPPIVDVTPKPERVEIDATAAELAPMRKARDALKKKLARQKATDEDIAMLRGLCRMLRDSSCIEAR
jgi:hypothetical protein